MKTIIQKKRTVLFGIISFFLLFTIFISCKKNIDQTTGNSAEEKPDLTTKVTSSVSGFVTDQNNNAVTGAEVKAGTSTTTTDQFGFFEIKNVQVVKEAATVTVTYTGYFKAIKTYMATEGKAAFFRVKLLKKTIIGTIDAAAGGNVSLSNGMNISFPANAIKDASGNIYNGMVNVAAQYIDPTSEELIKIMPGNLGGIDGDGNMRVLTSFGMMGAELTGSAGELLQIADGKKSTITMPVPASVVSAAPSTIPLWHFDERNGLWKEEGSATKQGNNYIGEVSHFSWWNCDAPNVSVQFDCRFVDEAGSPLSYAKVKLTVTNTGIVGVAYTDIDGYISGKIPRNSQILMEVTPASTCNMVSYSQNLNTGSSKISLGDIVAANALQQAIVTGTVTNCSNQPVTSGYIFFLNGNENYRYPVTNNGTFSFKNYLCSSAPVNINLIATDNTGLTAGAILTYNIHTGINTIPDIYACGTDISQFINYSIDGGVSFITISNPEDSIFQSGNGSLNPPFSSIGGHNYSGGIPASPWEASFIIPNAGIGVGSNQELSSFMASIIYQSPTIITTPTTVSITEYGPVGGFIAGNFTASVTRPVPPYTPYSIVCNFRVKRSF